MSDAFATIVVALISTIGVIIVGLMQLFKKEAREAAIENRQDHAIVQQQLRMIFKTVNRVDDKLEKHLDQHAEGTTNGKTARRN
jgi:hypothetical protein